MLGLSSELSAIVFKESFPHEGSLSAPFQEGSPTALALQEPVSCGREFQRRMPRLLGNPFFAFMTMKSDSTLFLPPAVYAQAGRLHHRLAVIERPAPLWFFSTFLGAWLGKGRG